MQERESKLSLNMLRLSVEEQRDREADLQTTKKVEKLVLDVYLQAIEISEMCTQGLKVTAEHVPRFPPDLKPLKQALEAATSELGKGFSAKRESRLMPPKSSSMTSGVRRRSELFSSFPTELDIDRERASDFFFTSVKPYLSLSYKEVVAAYGNVFPGTEKEAEDFAGLLMQNPLVCLCLSAKEVEEFLRPLDRDRALALAKSRFPHLIIQAHSVLVRNVRELTRQFVPLFQSLQTHVSREHSEVLHFCKEKFPKRTSEVEECIQSQEYRPTRYTNQQKELINKKISTLLSNQRGATEPFIMENKYIIEENVLRPGLKPKVKVEVVDERSESVGFRQDFLYQTRLDWKARPNTTSRKETLEVSVALPLEPKTKSQRYLESLKGIETRLGSLKVREKVVQGDFGKQRFKFVGSSLAFKAPVQVRKGNSLSSIEDLRLTVQPAALHPKVKLAVSLFPETGTHL